MYTHHYTLSGLLAQTLVALFNKSGLSHRMYVLSRGNNGELRYLSYGSL